jgi:beta-N-acetylhexosaminidase
LYIDRQKLTSFTEVFILQTSEIEKKVAQLLVFGFHGTTATNEIKELIRTDQVGGIILFSRNLGTKEEILHLNIDLQKEA